MSAPIHLFDISAYLHRAMYVSYGDRAATTDPSDRRFVQLACQMIASTMEKLDIRRMALICDSTEPSFRCNDFPAYKAERKAHYPVFTAQLPWFFDMMREMSVPVVSELRYEADDLIATLAVQSDGPTRYVIISSDKDLLALTQWHEISYYDPMKSLWVTSDTVVEKYGVKPAQLYDYTGLVGDTSDGIPGVAGIGAKTAARLLKEFGSLDNVYDPDRLEALGEVVSKKQLATLLASRTEAFLSRKLAEPWICHGLRLEPRDYDAPTPGIVRKACDQ